MSSILLISTFSSLLTISPSFTKLSRIMNFLLTTILGELEDIPSFFVTSEALKSSVSCKASISAISGSIDLPRCTEPTYFQIFFPVFTMLCLRFYGLLQHF
ncbi:hypothetical protein KFK09_001901 [Dendrobium nobile]|uniref:Uncharacterized protein n=1 Tax=Dendrobium nobile TaxID=94219 RepID=A0A8T3C6F2_DENNO|nr:hypothetical protein KFK09_001901 [Dendrobium nobile]